MSFWSDLYAGDAALIVRIFDDGDHANGAGVLAHAQLPGVVPDADLPNSPDLLTELAGTVANAGTLSFSGSIAEHLAGEPDPDEATSGVYRMSAEWVALFAELTDDQLGMVAQRWASECDPGETPQLFALVGAVRNVCRVARERDVSLIYSWTM